MINQETLTIPPFLDRLQSRALGLGAIALIASVLGFVFEPVQFLHSYVVGYILCLGFPCGALGLLLLQHLVGGAWGIMARRIMEAATRTLPLLAILFLPILFGMGHIYEWTHPAEAAKIPLKAAYINTPFFIIRFIIYFLIWFLLAYLLNRLSKKQDETGDVRILKKFQNLSGVGELLFVFTVNLALMDWVMTLNPEWGSTIFSLIIMIGQVLGFLAFIIIILSKLSEYEPYRETLLPSHVHDYGKLMFAFVLVWAYFTASQLIIIWSGNLPEEITWYSTRFNGGWQLVGLFLALVHFALPFVVMLSRNLKRNLKKLRIVAMLIIFMRWVDLYYMIEPQFSQGALYFHWLDIVIPIALVSLFVAYFAYELKKRPLLPIGDPFLEDALHPIGAH